MRAIKNVVLGRFPHESPFLHIQRAIWFVLLNFIVGVDDAEGPPVPIPNTEVKLSGAENSALATRCQNREMPTSIFLHSSVGRAHDC